MQVLRRDFCVGGWDCFFPRVVLVVQGQGCLIFFADGSDVPQKETVFVIFNNINFGHWLKGRFLFMLQELLQVWQIQLRHHFHETVVSCT